MATLVLTYHSHNIRGNAYAENDHVALASDLETLLEAGAQVVPLEEIVAALRGEAIRDEDRLQVGISFDDGPIFDVADIDHPAFGTQRSFLNILRDFQERHGASALGRLHATSFVIASPRARRAMERDKESGFCEIPEWLSEAWWQSASDSGLMAIGNHSWDHVHHSVPDVAAPVARRDDFSLVSDFESAEAEIRGASDYINAKLGGGCTLFAYPFGHVNAFLTDEYLPKCQDRHRMRGAFGIQGRAISPADSVWNIPRLVCGHDWRSREGLLHLLRVAQQTCA